MRLLGAIVGLLAMCSCTAGVPSELNDKVDIDIAKKYLGLHEVNDKSELRELLDVDPSRTEWCAAFVNAILELQDIPNLHDIDYAYPLTARGFLRWGEPIFEDEIRKGDIVVFPRGNQGWQGHVGFYVGTFKGQWIILGGNQDNTVSYKLYHPYNAIGIRRATVEWRDKINSIASSNALE